MSAAKIAQLLGNARREGRAWRCCCPLHNGRSLTLRDGDGGRLLVQCWGGCDRLDVLQELRRRGLLEGRTTDCRRGEVDNVRPPLPAMVALPLPAMVALPLPAMVALVEHVQRGPVAVHATYLRPDGNGKAGSVPRGEWIAVAEGVETALSIMVASAIPAWAALSAGGLERLALPPEAGMVLICADNDANGVGARAARTAGQRFLAEGRRVRLTTPPRVGDFNDVLLGLALSRSGEVRRVAD